MIKFTKKEIQKAINKQKNGINTVKITATTGKTYKITPKKYYGLLKQWNLFYNRNGRAPNYVTYVGTSKHPYVIHYQSTGYTCGPSSLKMAIQKYGDYKTETSIAKTCNTTSSGTAPSDLIRGAGKLGYTMKTISRNIDGVRKAIKQGKSVIAHIDTKPATCLGYHNNYGHWILIARASKAGNYWIFDPTKGFRKCKSTILDKAMLNRTINYYSVEPK